MTGSIERVLVPLDAAADAATAIDTAARLADGAGGRLHGFFVEDDDLMRLAGLPFAQEVIRGSGAEPFTLGRLKAQLRAAAERARRDLAVAAGRRALPWSFDVVSGDAWPGIATERDIVVAGALTRPVGGHFRLGCRWVGSVEAVPGPFLLARRRWGRGGAAAALLRDRGASSARLVEAALSVARARGDETLTLICAAALAGTPELDEWIAERIGRGPVRVQVEARPGEPGALQWRLRELDCRLLAIDAGAAEGGDRLRDVAERFACDLLIVR